MNRKELLESLFKSTLNPRIESLERDKISHFTDLKYCSDVVKEVDILFNELNVFALSENASEPHKEQSVFQRKDNQSSAKRERTPPLTISKTSSKLNISKRLDSSPSLKKSDKLELKSNRFSVSKGRKLKKTKTVAILNTTQNSTANAQKVSKDEIQKSKLSLKIEYTKDEIQYNRPKTTKAANANTSMTTKEVQKFEGNQNSKSNLLVNKFDLKNSISIKKILKKNPSNRGPLGKRIEDKSFNEEGKSDPNKIKCNKPSLLKIEVKEDCSLKTQTLINNIIISSDNKGIEEINENPTPKKEFLNTMDLLCDNWIFIGKFLNKSDLIKTKLISKKLSIQTLSYFTNLLENDIKMNDDKLILLREKNKEEDLMKPVSEFCIGRSAVKALDLLNLEKYKELFKLDKIAPEDIILPYRIYFTFMNRKDIYLKEDCEFWKECCKYFLSELKTGELIANSVKSLDFSNDNIYRIYHLTINKEKKFLPSYYSKICSTTGIIIFLIKDTLEYIGLINSEKKTAPVVNRLYKLYTAIIEQSRLRISHLKQLSI